jgi:hypothetical protein
LLTGGSIGYSNPAKKALEEAERKFESDNKASIVLSLGSGRRLPQSIYDDMKDGLWQILDDMVQSGEQTARELRRDSKILTSIIDSRLIRG